MAKKKTKTKAVKKTKKRGRDVSQTALSIVERVIGGKLVSKPKNRGDQKSSS